MATISFERSIVVTNESVADRIVDILNTPVSTHEENKSQEFVPVTDEERRKRIKQCLSHYKNS